MADDERNRLIEQKNRVDAKLAKVRREVTAIKANAYQNNRFVDPGFYREQTRELDKLRRKSQELQAQLGKLKDAKTWTTPALLSFFVDVARDRLPREEFDSIMSHAKRKASAQPNASSAPK